ncbi:unnamed protein product [Thelazia callipaeda]|uniref:Cofactor of BRCA1 n=1 Tax=Thelazia callipaeda TaxID=103827 RepID=A0A0N5CV40_THECL|nr:unnamed protein product [Thelazia callipaeda]
MASSSSANSDKQWVTDLENQNIDGCKKLRHLLMTCADPIATIKDFQERNSIRLPTLYPALRLLDLHGIRRSEFHEVAVGDISELLIEKIRELGEDDSPDSARILEKQLERCFKLYRVPLIRPVVLETLKQLPKAPDRYLKVILADRQLYNSCAVTVRQQIWLKNDSLFLTSITPVIDSYIDEKVKIMQLIDYVHINYFTSETTRSRRRFPQVVELMSMVGKHESLYRRLNDVVRKCFVKTGDTTYCTLRMEIVMSAHDLNIESVIRSDPCHDFAWCLDACVRDKHLDVQLTAKLKTLLDMKKLPSEAVGDFAMIAGDAHVIHFLSSMAVKVLRDSAVNGTGQLPRDLVSLQLILRLLCLGTKAHKVMTTKNITCIPNIDTLIFTRFLPSLNMLIVEDVIRHELCRAPEDIADENPMTDFLSRPSEEMMCFLKTNMICALLWLHYILDIIPFKRRVIDLQGMMRYLKIIPRLKEKVAFSNPWLHVFVFRLLQSPPHDNLLSVEQVSYFIIQEYLLKAITHHPDVKYQLLRIIHLMSSYIGDFRCRLLLDKIVPEAVCDLDDPELEVDLRRYSLEHQRVRCALSERSSAEGSSSTTSISEVPSITEM